MPGPQPQYRVSLTAEQVADFTHVSMSYTLPYLEVQRARVLLSAHHHPEWNNIQIAREVGCHTSTVREWRRRFTTAGCIESKARRGAPREFSPLQRTQIIALACSQPAEHGHVWKRWSGEKLRQVAIENKIVESISASTIRRWLQADKIKPWRYHSWQKSTDPHFVEKAAPVLELYEKAEELARNGEVICSLDEKTGIQARKPLSPTQAAISGHPIHVSDRYERMGAVQLFCALVVATGLTFARTKIGRKFVDFKEFLVELFARMEAAGKKVVHLILDNGKTHAPKQIGNWIASLELSFEVRIYWLPTHASWLNQVEIIFSKVQRDVLTPNDFASTLALSNDLMTYFDEMNQHPKPIHWTYTKAKMVTKFGSPEEVKQLAA
jgi:transposase